jgi:hypothetical protein
MPIFMAEVGEVTSQHLTWRRVVDHGGELSTTAASCRHGGELST